MGVTHEVTNQVPPLIGHDPIAGDAALAEACVRHADVATLDSLKALGALAGSERAQEWGRLANENPPRLRTHDRYGFRIDEVEFHPAWHELMRAAVGAGLAAGMGMTEKQGGSDVRANTTRAVARSDGSYALTGHKWFTSAPMRTTC